MKAMILSAGVGSRLYPLTDTLPKPMLPIVNKPALEYVVDLCVKHDIKDIKMNLHYLPEEIDGYFGDGKNFGANISYSLEKDLLGTAGAVKRVKKFFDRTFFILSGDGYSDIDLTEMFAFHHSRGALVTIAVKEVEDPSQFGVVVTSENGCIQKFQEKPPKGEELSNLVNTGVYIFEPEVLSMIPHKTSFDFGKDLFPKLLQLQVPFYAYRTSSYWTDIGDLREYWKLNLDIANKAVPGLGEDRKPQTIVNGLNKATLVMGKNCKIGSNVTFKNTVILGDNVTIGAGSIIDNSVVLSNTRIGKKIEIADSILNQNYNTNIKTGYGFFVEDEKVVAANESPLSSRLGSAAIDIINRTIAGTALLGLSPILLLAAAAIKLTSAGPVFYVSKRIQSPAVKNRSKRWSIYKKEKSVSYYVFRTMYINADKQLAELQNKYEGGPFIKIENDPRITPVGKILRKTSIDELPLLYNVLRGEMSLVGIWALPVHEAEALDEKGLPVNAGFDLSEAARQRFKGEIGLAGLWQSRGRSNLTAEERAIHDSYQAVTSHYSGRFKKQLGQYSEYGTLKGYFKMIFETFISVISHKGAM